MQLTNVITLVSVSGITYGKTGIGGKKARLKDNCTCITVTRTVYSKGRTKEELDADLHFNLYLDLISEKYSNFYES